MSDHPQGPPLPAASFADIAEQFCAWAEGDPQDEIQDARTARRLLAGLLYFAEQLPEPLDDPDSSDDVSGEDLSEEYQRVYRRFGSLPFNYYSQCFNPLMVPAEEPVTADLADDLADIWRDLKTGVDLFRDGRYAAADWHWRFHFEIHWGHHAASALYALQAWFSEYAHELSLAEAPDEKGPPSQAARRVL